MHLRGFRYATDFLWMRAFKSSSKKARGLISPHLYRKNVLAIAKTFFQLNPSCGRMKPTSSVKSTSGGLGDGFDFTESAGFRFHLWTFVRRFRRAERRDFTFYLLFTKLFAVMK